MLTCVGVADDHSFSADSGVGRYWLLNSVGFRVEGTPGLAGVVEEVGLGPDGVDVLAVRRRGVLGGRLVLVPAERVESVRPWEETIVLASRRRRARDHRTANARQVGRRVERVAVTGAVATGHAAGSFAGAVRGGALVVAAALVTAFRFAMRHLRRHTPRLRRALARAAATVAALAGAYWTEAGRAIRDQRAQFDEWRALRHRELPPPEDDPIGPPEEKAGAEDLDTRPRETIRR